MSEPVDTTEAAAKVVREWPTLSRLNATMPGLAGAIATEVIAAHRKAVTEAGGCELMPGEIPLWMTEFGKRSVQDGSSPEDGKTVTTYAMRGDL